jgi:hypothetical protein
METALALEDRSGPLALSREVAIRDTHEHFEKEESPEGRSWAPWAESYAKRTKSSGILKGETGDLQSSVTAPSAYPATDDSLFFNANVMPDYGFMNYFGSGGTIDLRKGESHPSFAGGDPAAEDIVLKGDGRGNALPARPMVGVSFEAQLQIAEIFEAWFDGAITGTFMRRGRVTAFKRGPGGKFAKQVK